LFDDSGLADALDKNAITFSEYIDRQLHELLRMLQGFMDLTDIQPIAEIIETPNWATMREKAQKIADLIERSGA